MIKSFKQIENKSFFDIIIIGSGAAGITLAKEFNNSKINVALIEAGDRSMSNKNQEYLKARSSGPLKSADLDKVRALQFGGTTNLWTSGNVQYDEIDFIDRPGLNIDGWPIKFNEIESYYHKAKSYVKISDSEFKEDAEINNLSKSFLNNPYFVQRNQIRRKIGRAHV